MVNRGVDQRVEYLTSAEALEELCKIQPSAHLSNGIMKTTAGAGLLAASGALAFGLYKFGHYIKDNFDGFLTAIGGIGAVVDLGLFSGGVFLLEDGINSFKHSRRKLTEGPVYHWNDGFSHALLNTSLLENNERKVVPIETVEELRRYTNESNPSYVLMNGLVPYLDSRDITHTSGFIGVNTSHATVLRSRFGESGLNLIFEGNNPHLAVRLAAMPSDYAIYLMGRIKARDDLLYVGEYQYGNAFTRRT